jgi:hypothetical protein
MLVDEVESVLRREPFVPLRLHRSNGGFVDIPFKHVAVILPSQGLLIFKGVKSSTSRQAKSYEVIGFDQIARIDPQRGRDTGPRRKAS